MWNFFVTTRTIGHEIAKLFALDHGHDQWATKIREDKAAPRRRPAWAVLVKLPGQSRGRHVATIISLTGRVDW